MVTSRQVYHNMLASFGMQDTALGGKVSVVWHALQEQPIGIMQSELIMDV